jgi:hypothetical protein
MSTWYYTIDMLSKLCKRQAMVFNIKQLCRYNINNQEHIHYVLIKKVKVQLM